MRFGRWWRSDAPSTRPSSGISLACRGNDLVAVVRDVTDEPFRLIFMADEPLKELLSCRHRIGMTFEQLLEIRVQIDTGLEDTAEALAGIDRAIRGLVGYRQDWLEPE